MKYKVLFTAFLVKKTPIRSSYRPDWTCDNKPDYNCAMLSFSDKEEIAPGESCECFLQPLVPSLWVNVAINDALRCMEGSRQVGEAVILEIMSPQPKGQATVS